jgi:hypothetical protein
MATELSITGVAVTRSWDFFGWMRGLRVLVDGKEAGRVYVGGRVEFQMEPGPHSVQVAMDWCYSPARKVSVRAGEVVELRARLRWRGVLWLLNIPVGFFCPSRLFVVQPAGEAG